jgi:outer membrane protein assembly factor BamB
LEADTGNEIWRVEKDEMFLGLAVANETIYVGNWDHHLYAFDRPVRNEGPSKLAVSFGQHQP